MSDEELVKRLRDDVNGEHDMTPHGADCLQAADRIEALIAENAHLERVVKDLSDEVDLAEQEASMVEDDFVKAEKEIEALTAKLAKAVEGLREIAGFAEKEWVTPSGEAPPDVQNLCDIARATLAKAVQHE
jgi:chromosome segregation ATPase